MIPPLDITEAFVRAWIDAPPRRWRRASLAGWRDSPRLDEVALWMAELREHQAGEWERRRACDA